MCTWSGIRWPSSIRLSFCVAKRRRTSPRCGRSWPNKAFRRPFGMNTTWYLHSQREWLRLSNSSIVARPSVCLAAHGSERHDGPPNMSNFCCLPGIAGGLPVFIYGKQRGAGARRQASRESRGDGGARGTFRPSAVSLLLGGGQGRLDLGRGPAGRRLRPGIALRREVVANPEQLAHVRRVERLLQQGRERLGDVGHLAVDAVALRGDAGPGEVADSLGPGQRRD